MVAALILCCVVLLLIWVFHPGRVAKAAYKGDTEQLAALLARGYDPNRRYMDAPGKGRWDAPILWAIRGQSPEAIRVLAEGGAEINEHARRYLLRSMYVECSECVLELLKLGVDPNSAMSDGTTILSLAMERGDTEVARHLLDYGADPIIANTNGATALGAAIGSHYAGRISLDDLKRLFRAMLEGGLDPDVRAAAWAYRRPSSETLLMFLAEHGELGLIALFIQFGADTNLTDEDGRTACDYANRRHDDAIDAVLELLHHCTPIDK